MTRARDKEGSPPRALRGNAKKRAKGGRDAEIVRSLAAWFARNGRVLPWRTDPRRAYPSLVSELMLQQTQVSRVLEKFGPFLKRFPSIGSLAGADEADVLGAWSGLGYYRRARLLHACAKAIVREHGGVIPALADVLAELPGIGRYTAGAIASIVFGEREAIVDGNVCRVLQRLDAKEGHAGDKRVMEWAWERAERLVALTRQGKEVARFNEGLMELGATVCTPDGPKCGECPLSGVCAAREVDLTRRIPAPKPRAKRAIVHHDVIVVYRDRPRGEREYLLERRPERGLWAGLWQPPARERAAGANPAFADVAESLGLIWLGARDGAEPRESVFHATHREIRFRVWRIKSAGFRAEGGRRWIARSALATVGISNAHLGLLVADR